MAKFKRAFRPGGFRPEQVSERNISQLQAYSDRITQSLREERDAVISDRNRTADAMKENISIQQKQADLNNKIQQQNIQTQIKEQQILGEQAIQEFNRQNEAGQALFGSLSKISETAARKFQEIEVKRKEEQYNADLAEMMILGENSDKFKAVEAYFLDAQNEEQRNYTELAKAQERGLAPLDADRYAKNLSELSLGLKVGYLSRMSDQYSGYLREELIHDETGSARDQRKAGEFSARALDEFMKIKGIKGINPALLKKSGFLDAALRVNQQFMNTAGKYEAADNLSLFEDNFKSGFGNQVDTASAKRFLEVQFPELVRRKGRTGALDFIQNLGEVVDVEGTPIYNTDAIFAAQLGPEGQAYGDYWKNRKASIQTSLVGASNAAARNMAQAERNASDKYVKDVMLPSLEALLAEAPASEDESIFSTAEREAIDKFGYIPKALSDARKQNLLQNKTETAQIATTAQALMVTGEPANINKARELISTITDPKVRGELVKQYQEATNPIQLNTDGKKELDKAVTAASRELLNQSLEGGASSKAIEFAGFIRPDVYRQYKEEYLKTRDPELAKQNTLSWLSSQVLQGKSDKTTRYAVATGDNNQSYMPYFQRKTKETQAERDARLTSVINTVSAVGVSALESPGMVTERELRKASSASEQAAGLDKIVTPETLSLQKALTTQGKPVTLGEIYNKQIEAFNRNNPDKKINPLGISPMLQIVDFAHPATLEALANNPTPAIVRRATHEAGGVNGLRAANFRLGGARPTRSAVETAFINTTRMAEGTAGPNGYNTVYGGAVVPQLTQMTLGELYDAIKLGGTDAIPERLGGGKIPFKKDKYNSSASGALQLMPQTLLGLINSGKYSRDDVFSPAVQDQMLIDLARDRGVDIENMSPQQMEKAGNIWAGLTPRYGQTKRTATDSYEEFQRQLNQLN